MKIIDAALCKRRMCAAKRDIVWENITFVQNLHYICAKDVMYVCSKKWTLCKRRRSHKRSQILPTALQRKTQKCKIYTVNTKSLSIICEICPLDSPKDLVFPKMTKKVNWRRRKTAKSCQRSDLIWGNKSRLSRFPLLCIFWNSCTAPKANLSQDYITRGPEICQKHWKDKSQKYILMPNGRKRA